MSELPSGTVTLLFTDIEGSTRLLQQLRDRYVEALDEHNRILRAVFAEHGGHEVGTHGDSFFVAFGRARDAVSAAVAGQRALAGHAWPDGAELRVRMGIHTGEPIAGGDNYTGLGVHRAARIGAAARGGQVLVSQTTRSLLRDDPLPDVALRDLGERMLKDIHEPERLYALVVPGVAEITEDVALDLSRERELLPGGAVPLPGPLVPTPPFPFVGRDGELATLRAALARAEGGEGGVALLGAEAGGGKTRLIRELSHEAAAHGVLVLYGASDAAVSTPYQPLREWLEFLIRVCDPDVLRDCLGSRGTQLAWLVPELERLTGTPPPERGDPESDRFALHSAVNELLMRLGRLQPLLVVLDDIHWADAETLHLLRGLARKAPEARLLVLAAYRDRGEDISAALVDTLAEVSRLDGATRLAPGNLSDEDVTAFIHASAKAEATSELVSAIGELTDGTPLFLCELWRDLRESGAVDVAQTVQLTRPLAELRGPERIQDIVQQRLFRLAPEAVATLELAAAAGAKFELRVLAAAAGLEPAALVAALESAVRNGIVEELAEPALTYRFTHELVRRSVYDRLTGLRRAELHLRVGDAMEQAHAVDLERVLPELAHHFTRAAPVAGAERGVAYNLRAAEAALASAALQEAAASLSRALELGIAEPHERVRVQLDLAWLLGETGQGAQARAVLDEALEAANRLGDRGLAAHARVIGAWRQWLGLPILTADEMGATAEDAIATFTELDDTLGLARARHLLSVAESNRGRRAKACDELEQALVHADAAGSPLLRSRVIASLVKGQISGPTPVADGIQRCEELLRGSRGQTVLEATIERGLSALSAMAGRDDDAREYQRHADEVLDQLDYHTPAWFRFHAAEALLLLGDTAAAERHLLAMWQRFGERRGGVRRTQAVLAGHALAMLCCDEGRWDEAEQWLESVDAPAPPGHISLGSAAAARLAAHRGELEEATLLAHRAVEEAEQVDMLNEHARVWLALAEVLRENNQAAEADAAVEAAIGLYEQKGNVAALVRLRAAESAEHARQA